MPFIPLDEYQKQQEPDTQDVSGYKPASSFQPIETDNPIVEQYQSAPPEEQDAIVKILEDKASEQRTGFQKFTDFFTKGKALQTGADIFTNPISRELVRPVVSAVRETQKRIPGGKEGIESVDTPFGEVKPYSQLSSGEAAMGVVDVASVLPVEKLFTSGLKLAGKLGRGVLEKGGELLTAVPKENLSKWFNLAKTQPKKLEMVNEIIQENPQQPFLALADRIGSKIKAMKEDAQKAFSSAKETFEQTSPDVRFDVSHKVPELKSPLEDFGLTLRQVKDKGGKMTGEFVVEPKGKITDLNQKELGFVQDLVNNVRSAKGLTLDDLTALRGKFARAYDAVPLNLDGQPTKYHALVKSLENAGEKIIHDALPDTIKEANKLYQDYWIVQNKIGHNILDASGQTKQGAETFLGNLMNVNKGAQRRAVEEASQKLGIDILDNSQNLRLAKDVSESVPSSVKNRTTDIVKGVAVALGGGSVATGNLPGVVGAVLLNIITRPSVYSNLIEVLAKTSAKLPISKTIKMLTPQELSLFQQIIQKTISAPFREKIAE